MDQSPSWESNNYTANQEISRLLLNPNVHYRVHNTPPLVPVLSRMNPIHTFHPFSLRSTLILHPHLYLGLPSGRLPSVFRTKVIPVCHLSHVINKCYGNLGLELWNSFLVIPRTAPRGWLVQTVWLQIQGCKFNYQGWHKKVFLEINNPERDPKKESSFMSP
jgi:hypothetical protein